MHSVSPVTTIVIPRPFVNRNWRSNSAQVKPGQVVRKRAHRPLRVCRRASLVPSTARVCVVDPLFASPGIKRIKAHNRYRRSHAWGSAPGERFVTLGREP